MGQANITLEDGTVWPNPDDDELGWRLMNTANNSRADVLLAVRYISAYRHLAAHPAPTKSIIHQLRLLRAFVRGRRKAQS